MNVGTLELCEAFLDDASFCSPRVAYYDISFIIDDEEWERLTFTLWTGTYGTHLRMNPIRGYF